MAPQKIFTLSQVAHHKSKTSCWFVIHGRVLDVTKFLEEHPGGDDVLLEAAGKDATKDFEDIGHSKAAQNFLLKYQVGVIQGYNNIQDGGGVASDATNRESETETAAGKEMSAFVIKDDSTTSPKYAVLLEFLVPLLVAGFFFGYRCLSGSANLMSTA